MGRYLLKRLINYMIMFFVAVSLAYFLAASRLNPLLLYDITNPNLDWDSINASLSDKNLNPSEPILSRYWDWLTGVVHGDWGQKPKSGSVNDEIANRVPVSFRLVIGGFLIGSIGGILLGAWTATKQYKPSDRIVTLWSLIIISTPMFVIAVVLQIVTIRLGRAFDFQWEFLGESGVRDGPFITRMLDRGEHLLLPTLTLAIPLFAIYSRYQRNLMLDTLHADYVRTARAKGLTKRRAVFKHALRTALIPVGHAVRLLPRRRVHGRDVHRDVVRMARDGRIPRDLDQRSGRQRCGRRRRLRRGGVLPRSDPVRDLRGDARPAGAGGLRRRHGDHRCDRHRGRRSRAPRRVPYRNRRGREDQAPQPPGAAAAPLPAQQDRRASACSCTCS